MNHKFFDFEDEEMKSCISVDASGITRKRKLSNFEYNSIQDSGIKQIIGSPSGQEDSSPDTKKGLSLEMLRQLEQETANLPSAIDNLDMHCVEQSSSNLVSNHPFSTNYHNISSKTATASTKTQTTK